MTLPAWLTPLNDADGQGAIDRWAMEDQGADWLMERAGTGLAALAEALAPEGRIAVLVGKGNNGGDGLVAACRLREAGRDVDVYCVTEELQGEPAEWLRRLPGDPPHPLETLRDRSLVPGRYTSALTLVIDALLGTGFSGSVRPPLDAVFDVLDGLPILAADVPSGVDASTGEVHVIDIGVPRGAPEPADVGLLTAAVLDDYPRRASSGSKFTSGAVVVLGGSRGLTGAPIMAAHAAMRAGAGYVTIAGAESNEAAFAARPVEAMLKLLPDDAGALGDDAIGPALAAAERAGAVVLGPGLGRGDEAQAFVSAVLRGVDAPVVIDADGLNAIAPLTELPVDAAVLTPHAAELGRLLDLEPDEVGARRLHHVREAAAKAGNVVVLKGDDTLIAHPDGRVAVSPGGAPGLATAGTGDVLSGVIAAMLARGLEPWHAACAGVWLHLQAGRLAARPHGPDGMIATDVIAALPAALAG